MLHLVHAHFQVTENYTTAFRFTVFQEVLSNIYKELRCKNVQYCLNPRRKLRIDSVLFTEAIFLLHVYIQQQTFIAHYDYSFVSILCT